MLLTYVSAYDEPWQSHDVVCLGVDHISVSKIVFKLSGSKLRISESNIWGNSFMDLGIPALKQ